MSGLTAEKKKTLDGLIVEYGISLHRTDDEKVKRKEMEEKAQAMGIKPKHFRMLATAAWKGTSKAVQADLGAQLDLFDLYCVGPDEGGRKGGRKEAQEAYRWLKGNGAALEIALPGALQ